MNRTFKQKGTVIWTPPDTKEAVRVYDLVKYLEAELASSSTEVLLSGFSLFFPSC